MTTHRQWISLLFLATVAWGQAAKPAAPPAPPKAASHAASAAGAGTIGPGTAVITIPGLCDKPPADKSKAADCKTVVTRAEFEQLLAAVAPTMEPPAKKQLASQYGNGAGDGGKSARNGSRSGARFQQLMKVARIGVLTKELSQNLQEQAAEDFRQRGRDLLSEE